MTLNLNDVTNEADQLLTGPQVAELLQCSYWSILAWNRNPLIDFPAPLKVSPRSRRWKLSDIRAFIDSRDR